MAMDDTTRKQMVDELEILRAQVKAGGARDAELSASVDQLRQLVSAEPAPAEAPSLARELEQRLLAWEAEHPKLVALAARVAHALEDSGL
jgi:hypothetical protein